MIPFFSKKFYIATYCLRSKYPRSFNLFAYFVYLVLQFYLALPLLVTLVFCSRKSACSSRKNKFLLPLCQDLSLLPGLRSYSLASYLSRPLECFLSSVGRFYGQAVRCVNRIHVQRHRYQSVPFSYSSTCVPIGLHSCLSSQLSFLSYSLSRRASPLVLLCSLT